MQLTFWRVLLALLFAIGLCGTAQCQTGRMAMKGFELYSWMEGPEWRFSLLAGTNRLKFCPEVRRPKGAMALEQLEQALRDLGSAQSVFWPGASFLASGDECGIAYPPDDIVARIRALCRARDLFLTDQASTAK